MESTDKGAIDDRSVAAVGFDIAVSSICEMASRRGLFASRQEAEQAWRNVSKGDLGERFAATWAWLFQGHSVERMPVELIEQPHLPAWLLAGEKVGIVRGFASESRDLEIDWIGGAPQDVIVADEVWVPVSPGMAPAVEADSARTPRGPASEALITALKAHLPLYGRVALITVFINCIAVLASLFTMQVYDRVVPNLAYATFFVLASGVLLAYVFDFIFKVLRLKLLDASARRLDEALSLYIFERVMHMKIDRRPTRVGQLVSQVRDYESIKNFMQASSMFAVADLPFALMFTAVIAMIGGTVALVPLIFIPITVLIGLAAYKPISKHLRDQNELMARRQGVLFEALAGAEVVKAHNGESFFANLWHRATRETGARTIALHEVSSYAQFSTNFVQQIAYIGILAVGVYEIQQGNLTTGGLIACSILGGRALGAIAGITNIFLQWHNARYALDVLNSLLASPSDAVTGREVHSRVGNLELRLEGLRYGYEGAAAPQLQVPKLLIRHGARIAIIGRNGGGKSTLMRLLAGLATPSAGEVRIAGLDMQQCRLSWLRETIGYLPQDVRLFSGTLEENLTMGIARPSEEKILEALQTVGLGAAVARHPLGLKLPMKEGGYGLSGGQRQMVGLARLILQDPGIWILDEPSASLDNETEERLMRFLATLPRSKTLIFSTHRPRWLSLADRVLIIEDGVIKTDAPASEVRAMRGAPQAQAAGAALKSAPASIGPSAPAQAGAK
jgi:ATP-binding cassette subfamily C protein LapB